MFFPRIQFVVFPWVNLRSVCMGMYVQGGVLAIFKGNGIDIFVCIYFLSLLLTTGSG